MHQPLATEHGQYGTRQVRQFEVGIEDDGVALGCHQEDGTGRRFGFDDGRFDRSVEFEHLGARQSPYATFIDYR